MKFLETSSQSGAQGVLAFYATILPGAQTNACCPNILLLAEWTHGRRWQRLGPRN